MIPSKLNKLFQISTKEPFKMRQLGFAGCVMQVDMYLSVMFERTHLTETDGNRQNIIVYRPYYNV
jgi:hypothetical protein